MQIRSILVSGLCAALLAGCNGPSGDAERAAKRGQAIFAKECSQCHGTTGEGAGAASLGLGMAPPSLVTLAQRNDGAFPYDYVRRFVMGVSVKAERNEVMPEFATVGLQHVYPDGGADGEVLEGDFEDLLTYLETIQR
jgi:mono/diheme cytochrome c family protein